MPSPTFDYRTISPSPALREIVNSFVFFQGSLPEGCAWCPTLIPNLTGLLYFNLNACPQMFVSSTKKMLLKDALVIGQFSEPLEANLTANVNLIGVHMKAHANYRLFNLPMHHLANHARSLQDLAGERAHHLLESIRAAAEPEACVAIIESFLLDQLRHSRVTVTHQKFLLSTNLIASSRGTRSIRDLARDINTSEKNLQRIFALNIGISPKVYSRIQKINAVIAYFNQHKRFTRDLIFDLGYYDQSHFINDFKRLTGQPPLAYFKAHDGANEFFSRL